MNMFLKLCLSFVVWAVAILGINHVLTNRSSSVNVAVVERGIDLPKPFFIGDGEGIKDFEEFLTQANCMALNVYREAGNQPYEGKAAVAQVVLNRTQDERWPDTPCEVIYQRNRRACQFSWTCEPNLHTVRLRPGDVRAEQAWRESNQVAWEALTGTLPDVVGDADHYHATYVSPGWRNRMTRVARVGDHIFYAH